MTDSETAPQRRPVARPIASSPLPASPLVGRLNPLDLAHDIDADHGSARSYRRGEGEQRLSVTDWQVLVHVHRFRVMSGKQLSRLFFDASDASQRAARRLLLRLVRTDLLARLDRQVGGTRGGSAGYLYVTGTNGQRLLGDGRRARRHREPGWSFLQHTLGIAELYVECVIHSDSNSEASLLTFDPEPHCWRTHVDGSGTEHHLRPDAFAITEHPNRRSLWFVEFDRGTESTTTIRRKMQQYVTWLNLGIEQERLGAFPRVIWHCDEPKRRASLQRLAENAAGPAGLHSTTGLIESLTADEPP